MADINQTPCLIREVDCVSPVAVCDRCQHPAQRFSTAVRRAGYLAHPF